MNCLILETKDEAFDALRSGDDLLRCLVALGDEQIERKQAISILQQAKDQVEEWKESQSERERKSFRAPKAKP